VVFGSLKQGFYHYSGTFLFCNSSFWLCASVLSLGQCVVAEAGCNWYFFDINIFPLSKKYTHMYSLLSDMKEQNAMAMAQHLLVAAQRQTSINYRLLKST
jgi:hypothetical protein